MNQKYMILLVTISLLVSCGQNNNTSPSNEEVSNQLPEVEAPSKVLEEINEETSTIIQQQRDNPEKVTDLDIEAPKDQWTKEEPLEVLSEEEASAPSIDTQESVEKEDIIVVLPPAENMLAEEELITPIIETPTEEKKVIELNQTYTSPAWEEDVAFTINMLGDTIENISVLAWKNVVNNITKARINAFAEAVTDALMGKTLQEAKNVEVIGGSSLTTGAFKKAIKDM